MSYLLRTIARRRLLSRPLTTSPVLPTCCRPAKRDPPSLVRHKKLRALFQAEDGLPIWLKAGLMDRILYSSTIIGCYTGVCMVLGTIYDNAKPPSWKKEDTC